MCGITLDNLLEESETFWSQHDRDGRVSDGGIDTYWIVTADIVYGTWCYTVIGFIILLSNANIFLFLSFMPHVILCVGVTEEIRVKNGQVSWPNDLVSTRYYY